jgi:nucleotide-binding universal stress UspA family protein
VRLLFLESPQFKRLLVAVDGSDNAARAARVAIALAEKFNAELIVCHAIQTPFYSFAQDGLAVPADVLKDYVAAAREDAKIMVDKLVQLAHAYHVNAVSLIQENIFSVVEAIVNLAESRGVDLIVIGTRGQTGFKKLLMGSVSSGVMNHAHCPVLVVR